MKPRISYKTINIATLLIWASAMNGMETTPTDFVTKSDVEGLLQSMIIEDSAEKPSLKSSQGWYDALTSWVCKAFCRIDVNLVAKLEQGTLTKAMLTQDIGLQEQAQQSILDAINAKRTNNLCILLNKLQSFNMLSSVAQHREVVTQFLNEEIKTVCEKKGCSELMTILNTMTVVGIGINDDLRAPINDVLNEQKNSQLQTFKNAYKDIEENTIKLKELMKKDNEVSKNAGQELTKILALQYMLAGQIIPKNKQLLKDLDIEQDVIKIKTLVGDLNKFLGEK